MSTTHPFFFYFCMKGQGLGQGLKDQTMQKSEFLIQYKYSEQINLEFVSLSNSCTALAALISKDVGLHIGSF